MDIFTACTKAQYGEDSAQKGPDGEKRGEAVGRSLLAGRVKQHST